MLQPEGGGESKNAQNHQILQKNFKKSQKSQLQLEQLEQSKSKHKNSKEKVGKQGILGSELQLLQLESGGKSAENKKNIKYEILENLEILVDKNKISLPFSVKKGYFCSYNDFGEKADEIIKNLIKDGKIKIFSLNEGIDRNIIDNEIKIDNYSSNEKKR